MPQLPESNVSPMLIDPGKFVVDLAANMTVIGFSAEEMAAILTMVMESFCSAAPLDDRPVNMEEWLGKIIDYADRTLEEYKGGDFKA